MICPNCNKKINYWREVPITKEHNLKKGFYCPKCNTLLIAKNPFQIKNITILFIIIGVPVLYFSLIYLGDNFLNNNFLGELVLYLIVSIIIIIGLFFVFRKKFKSEELVVKQKNINQKQVEKFNYNTQKDPLMQKIRQNINNAFLKNKRNSNYKEISEKQASMISKGILIYISIMAAKIAYDFFKGEVDIDSFLFTVPLLIPLLVWALWIKKKKGEKWSLLIGLFITIIVAVIIIYILITIEGIKLDKENNLKFKKYSECIKEQMGVGGNINNIDTSKCLNKH